jgi:hypothetical protein
MLKMVKNIGNVLKMILFFEKTIRNYVHIINPRKFNWKNLPMSTSMSLSASVSMDTDGDRDMDVDVGRGQMDTDRDMDVDVDVDVDMGRSRSEMKSMIRLLSSSYT